MHLLPSPTLQRKRRDEIVCLAKWVGLVHNGRKEIVPLKFDLVLKSEILQPFLSRDAGSVIARKVGRLDYAIREECSSTNYYRPGDNPTLDR